MKLLEVKIEENVMIVNNIFFLFFEFEYLVENFKLGNFVNILIDKESIYFFLRRFFSIFFVEGKRVYIGYKVVGKGIKFFF